MEDLAQDTNTEDISVAMDDKTIDADVSNNCSVVGDSAIDMNDIQPVTDDCALMEESDNLHKDGSVPNECADVSSDPCLSQLDSVNQNECDVIHDDTNSNDIRLDTESAQCGDAVKSSDTGVDSDLLLLTLEGSSDKQDVLINELQNKEKVISELRIRVAELEAQLGIMPSLRSVSTKRPPSRFIDHMTPSLKRARARSSTPSRRISVHLKSLKRARLRSPLCLGSGGEHADAVSQSSILSAEDMDVLAVEVSHRLSSNLVADITAQVLQEVLPLMDLHADPGNESNHIVQDISAASTSSESYSADHNINSSTAVQSGQSTQGSVDFAQAGSNASLSAKVSSKTGSHLATSNSGVVTVPRSSKVQSLTGNHLIVQNEVTSLTGSHLVVNKLNSAGSSDASPLKGSPLIVEDFNTTHSSNVATLSGSHLIGEDSASSVPCSNALAGSNLVSESNANSSVACSNVGSPSPYSHVTQSNSEKNEVAIEKQSIEVLKDDDTEIDSSMLEKTIGDLLSSSSSTSSTEAMQVENNLEMASSETIETANSEKNTNEESMLTAIGGKEVGQNNDSEKPAASVVSKQAKMAGTSSTSGSRDADSSSRSSIPRPNNIKVHIPNIFRQRHVRPQTNLPRQVQQLPVRHPGAMSASGQFGMNMQRIPMPGNMGSPSANALMMQQLMNSPAGAQAAQALSHLNQMNRLAALQAQHRGTRPQLQNTRFSPQASPLMSPRANSVGAGVNMGQARNMALSAAFRRAVSSRVLTGQGLNMNNR